MNLKSISSACPRLMRRGWRAARLNGTRPAVTDYICHAGQALICIKLDQADLAGIMVDIIMIIINFLMFSQESLVILIS